MRRSAGFAIDRDPGLPAGSDSERLILRLDNERVEMGRLVLWQYNISLDQLLDCRERPHISFPYPSGFDTACLRFSFQMRWKTHRCTMRLEGPHRRTLRALNFCDTSLSHLCC